MTEKAQQVGKMKKLLELNRLQKIMLTILSSVIGFGIYYSIIDISGSYVTGVEQMTAIIAGSLIVFPFNIWLYKSKEK